MELCWWELQSPTGTQWPAKGVLQDKADVPFPGSLSRLKPVMSIVTTHTEAIQKVVVDKWYISNVTERHKITIFLLTQHIFWKKKKTFPWKYIPPFLTECLLIVKEYPCLFLAVRQSSWLFLCLCLCGYVKFVWQLHISQRRHVSLWCLRKGKNIIECVQKRKTCPLKRSLSSLIVQKHYRINKILVRKLIHVNRYADSPSQEQAVQGTTAGSPRALLRRLSSSVPPTGSGLRSSDSFCWASAQCVREPLSLVRATWSQTMLSSESREIFKTRSNW